ncbi:hypothetical protein ABTZ59_27195 [Streptomyces sp. NPDC094034]|uniref:hypothetical protein n=1 Tax=Streptomyces sp. NPDC094034 TaxID=3155309 RepID=UPI003325940B
MVGELHPELLGKFSDAGFRVHEVIGTRDDLAPVLVARYVTQLHADEGRRDVIIDHAEQDLHSKINEEWERTARECGLFSMAGDGWPEFLVGVDVSVDMPDESEFKAYRWVRVSLSDGWDVAGAGCESGLLGSGRDNPTFVMMSVTGDVVMVAGYWQIGIGFSVASHPERILKLREHARRIASYEHIESAQRDWAERWVMNVNA